jgi:uncharacterized protein YjbI with pentapeptide repeats
MKTLNTKRFSTFWQKPGGASPAEGQVYSRSTVAPDLSYSAVTEMNLDKLTSLARTSAAVICLFPITLNANFSAARLEDSNLSRAIMIGSYFRAASMRRTRTQAANLKSPVLASTDLRSAIFRETLLDECNFH